MNIHAPGPLAVPPEGVLNALLTQGSDAVAVTDPAGRIAWSNPGFEALFGSAAETLIVDLLASGPAATTARQMIASALAGEATAPFALACTGAAGAALQMHVTPVPLGDQQLWILRDDTACFEATRKAQRANELIATMQEFGRLGVWERELPDGVGRWDKLVFEYWGLDPEQGTPDLESATSRIHPDDRAAVRLAAECVAPGRYSARYRVVPPDGGLRWIHSQWEVKAASQGVPARAVGIMMDDTPAFAAARTLDEAQAQWQLAEELANIAIWRYDLRTERVFYSARARSVLGRVRRDEGYGIEEVREQIHPDDRPLTAAALDRALQGGGPVDVQARYRHGNGGWRQLMTRRVLERGADGSPHAIIVVALDVTEQVEHERHTIELARRLEVAAATADLGIWSRDPHSDAGEWNAQMYAMVKRDPALGMPSRKEWLERYVHPEDRAVALQSRVQLSQLTDGHIEYECRVLLPDGEVRWLVNRARLEHWNEQVVIFGVTLDVTDSRRAMQALRQADQRAALAARSAGIGTWESSMQTGQERWDEQMFRLRGLAPQATPPARERRLALLHPDDRSITIDSLQDTPGDVQMGAYEFRVIWPDGSIHWLASRSIVVFDDQGRPDRRVGVNWDVTETRNAEAARQDKALAERASRAKSEFLSRISHELRTPLNAVLGFTQLLQHDAAQGQLELRQDRLGHIRHAGEHLLALINDMLDLSGLEAGELRLDLDPVNAEGLLQDTLAMMAPMAEQQGVTLRAGPLAGWALADARRLKQVMVNLLSNAIKYNQPGGSVDVTARRRGLELEVTVSDSGPGLTPQQRRHLFEPFNRLGQERSGIAGTGIGLVIVKNLVEGMQGQVSVHSETGKGTRFTLRLPLAEPPATQELPATAQVLRNAVATPATPAMPIAPSANAPARARLLYIEDNAVNVMLVTELVATLPGLSLDSEATGQAGVERALAERPDLILIDMQLPDFDGLEVLRRLRADARTASIACVALSANAMPEDIARARAAGFADYWTKPIDFKAFLAALARRFPA
jgi:signal transduction histidine kinase/ActR/RegA family two-component response regulator